MKRAFLCLLLMLSSPALRGQADIEEETARRTEIIRVESALGEEERSVSGELSLDGSYDAEGALARLWDRFLQALLSSAKRELGFAWKLVMIAALCSIAGILSQDRRVTNFAEMAACCSAALLLAGSAESVIPEARDTLYRLSDYGKAAFPAFFLAVASCGASVSATVKYASVCFASNLFMELSQRILLPLISAYLSVGITLSLAGNAFLKAAERLLKWCIVTAMTLFTGGFCTYISLSGVISGSADAVAVKAAKSVISTLLPVVGGILSDSASTMLAAASVIKNSAGVFCLIAVCAICAAPFGLLLAKMLLLKAAAALSEMGSCDAYAGLLSTAGNAMGMLLGLVGCYGVMLFYSFMSGIRMAA